MIMQKQSLTDEWKKMDEKLNEDYKNKKSYLENCQKEHFQKQIEMAKKELSDTNLELETTKNQLRTKLKENLKDVKNLTKAKKSKNRFWCESVNDLDKTLDLEQVEEYKLFEEKVNLSIEKNNERFEAQKKCLEIELFSYYGKHLNRILKEYKISKEKIADTFENARKQWMGCRGVLLALRQEIVEAKSLGQEYKGSDERYIETVRKRWINTNRLGESL